MKSVGIKTAGVFAANQLFNPNHRINSDGLLDPWIVFKSLCDLNQIECKTLDVFQSESRLPTEVLFLDIPKFSKELFPRNQSLRQHLVLQECEVVIPRNWQIRRHQDFDKIFTWNPDIVDGKKYFHLSPAQDLTPTFSTIPFKKRKLCHIISGNKMSFHAQELYSERVRVIEFFEKYYPDDFDLYGMGWDAFPTSQIYFRILNRMGFLKSFVPSRPSYRGKVDTKREVMKNYKFSVCLENANGFKGYITEKVFDCLKNGVVPFYKGAPNIGEVLPKDCYVDFGQFKSYEEMRQYMVQFTETAYDQFLQSAERFLKSDKAQEYSSKNFANTLFQEIIIR